MQYNNSSHWMSLVVKSDWHGCKHYDRVAYWWHSQAGKHAGQGIHQVYSDT